MPILLAIGGVTLGASLFATWFEVQRGSFSGVEGPSSSQIRELAETFSQTGWEYWDGGDVALFVLGVGLDALAIYDAVRHEVPHPVLAVAAFFCAIALGVLLAEGFAGDRVVLDRGDARRAAGQVIVDRTRGGGQWVALIGLVVALGRAQPGLARALGHVTEDPRQERHEQAARVLRAGVERDAARRVPPRPYMSRMRSGSRPTVMKFASSTAAGRRAGPAGA